jgi:hypothetical protein
MTVNPDAPALPRDLHKESPGMTVRETMAMHLLAGMLDSSVAGQSDTVGLLAGYAVEASDALIGALNKRGGGGASVKAQAVAEAPRPAPAPPAPAPAPPAPAATEPTEPITPAKGPARTGKSEKG